MIDPILGQYLVSSENPDSLSHNTYDCLRCSWSGNCSYRPVLSGSYDSCRCCLHERCSNCGYIRGKSSCRHFTRSCASGKRRHRRWKAGSCSAAQGDCKGGNRVIHEQSTIRTQKPVGHVENPIFPESAVATNCGVGYENHPYAWIGNYSIRCRNIGVASKHAAHKIGSCGHWEVVIVKIYRAQNSICWIICIRVYRVVGTGAYRLEGRCG
jgi:hypothetical protein